MVRIVNLGALLWAVLSSNLFYLAVSERSRTDLSKPCQSLRSFQYACEPPLINAETQQPLNCNEDNSVTVTCKVANGVQCRGLLNGTRYFQLTKPNACSYHAHLHHSTALLLSIFLGFLGIDRMYLGYYAVGIIKMFSLGGLFVLWLIDVVLIALQLLQPADGSGFIINYYGPRVSPLRFDGATNYSVYTCIDCL
nr:TM2 domain containing protein [Haemonchus contortus]